MATISNNRNQSFVPDSPEFDDLEVRCTWSGEYEELANLRITLEVKCVPNTRLQLLNVRDNDIYLKNAFADCLSREFENQMDNQEEDDTPQSPLFGFSPLIVECEKEIGVRPSVEDSAESVYVSEASSIRKDDDESLEDHKNPQHDRMPDTESTLGSPASAVCSPRPPCRLPGSGPSTTSRKRSATDAELPDSDNEDEIGGVLREITPRNSRQTSPAMSTTAEKPCEITIACPTSPRRSGLLVRKENASPTRPIKPAGGVTASDKLILPGMLAHEEKTSRKPSKIPKPTFTPENSPLRSSMSIASIARTAILRDQAVSHNNVVGQTAAVADPITEVVRMSNNADFAATTELGRSREQHPPSSPASKLEPVLEEPESCSEHPESQFAPRSLEDPTYSHDHVESNEAKLSDQPEVKLVDGLIILNNSEKVQPATFKVTITVSFYIPFPNEQGWSDLMIPGLPRTGNGKSGFFLFLMPSRHGLELRTLNVKRAKLVENCFIAQFVNSGNLVIPMRRCDRRYGGDVTDFTVDQEVAAHSVVKTTASHQGDREKFELRFNVMFSVKLHNRCFWTDRCSILLYVDGGPEGSYHCDLSPRKGGLKKIHILANEYAETGVAYIHVTCSPKDLEKLCLTWVSSGTGREAAYWVPRIYSASPVSRERTRDFLRHNLMEMLSKSTYFFFEARARRGGFAHRNEPTQGDGHAELAIEDVKDQFEDSSSVRTVSIGQLLSLVERAVQLQLVHFAQDPRQFLKWALVGLLCLTFLGTRALSPVKPIYLCPGQAPPVAQVGLEAADSATQISQLDTLGKAEHGLDNTADGESIAGLDMLSMLGQHGAVDVGSVQSEMPLETEREYGEQSGDINAESGAHEESPNSIRDRIDYWLGWSGPIE
ncbi:hypothetical protein ASPCAL06441 [Aspergillus calidoustus]|uniref:Uncharacterized protein n=1 Tax=Aspergillus calidoustus TaxID=454130 RepID=A0A0U5G0P7_ASPCI|nr:hypothetical protein ASPCAL06441 [Aspergillus calidoustus]